MLFIFTRLPLFIDHCVISFFSFVANKTCFCIGSYCCIVIFLNNKEYTPLRFLRQFFYSFRGIPLPSIVWVCIDHIDFAFSSRWA